jgi:hypothetical protein
VKYLANEKGAMSQTDIVPFNLLNNNIITTFHFDIFAITKPPSE